MGSWWLMTWVRLRLATEQAKLGTTCSGGTLSQNEMQLPLRCTEDVPLHPFFPRLNQDAPALVADHDNLEIPIAKEITSAPQTQACTWKGFCAKVTLTFSACFSSLVARNFSDKLIGANSVNVNEKLFFAISRTRAFELRKRGLRDRNSPTCTLSQNGYGDNVVSR